eukprot:s3551_g7.t1
MKLDSDFLTSVLARFDSSFSFTSNIFECLQTGLFVSSIFHGFPGDLDIPSTPQLNQIVGSADSGPRAMDSVDVVRIRWQKDCARRISDTESYRVIPVISQWKGMEGQQARGYPMCDAARHSLAVQLDDTTLEPADISIWDEGPEDAVPLEFLFAGAPSDCDEQRLGDALRTAVEERLQAEARAEFRSQLKQRQESSLRRRKVNAAEEGDAAEEKWRSYLQKPAPEVKLTVHKVFDAGTRMRKVLGCRVSLSPEAAQELGKICFRHVFESEEEERERLQKLKWYEDPFLKCFYGCSCVLILVVVLWLCMLVPAVFRHF